MRRYRILLVLVISVLTSSEIQSTTTETGQALTFTNAIVAETNPRRFLRVNKSTTDSYSFKDIDRGDNGGDVIEDSKADTSNVNNPQERAGEVTALQKLKSLKTLKTLSRTMSRASKGFSDKVSPILPLKSKLQVWSNNGKSIDFVKKELKLDRLTGNELTKALKYYDDFVTYQLPNWIKKKLTPDEVIAHLGLQGLSGTALTSNRDFKHYDDFMKTQTLVWGREDLSVDNVLVRLGLNSLTGTARKEAVNYKYYDDFLNNQLIKWMENGDKVDDVMARLKLSELSGKDILAHPNYSYYKDFIKAKLRLWATDGVSPSIVQEKLGLGGLQGRALETHPNYNFLKTYIRKRFIYQEDGLLKQGRTTYEIWKMLEVYRVKDTVRKSSPTYDAYRSYVNKLDDYIIELKNDGFAIPDLISSDASKAELWEKTFIWVSEKRPDWYVKYSLGLDGLSENLLKKSPNFQLYNYYRSGLKLPPIGSST